MANLYTLAALGSTFRPFKNMVTLYNGVGSGQKIKVWKIWALNNQTVAVTGVLTTMELRFVGSLSGGGQITPTKHNSSIESLPPQVIAAEGAICSLGSYLRKVLWSSDEPAAISSAMDEVALIPQWTVFWNTTLNNSNGIEPIVLNEGQGITVYLNTNTAVGLADFFMDFTSENT